MCKVISVSNQKGGIGKSSVVANLGIGLARSGKKVLLIDADPQGSLTASLGYQEPDDIRVTLATIMTCIINEEDFPADYGILHHEEGVDLLPANIELSGLEVSLSNTMSREMILRDYIEQIRDLYDYILIDCMPSLGVMTINALAAADRVLIPVQAAYLPVRSNITLAPLCYSDNSDLSITPSLFFHVVNPFVLRPVTKLAAVDALLNATSCLTLRPLQYCSRYFITELALRNLPSV